MAVSSCHMNKLRRMAHLACDNSAAASRFDRVLGGDDSRSWGLGMSPRGQQFLQKLRSFMREHVEPAEPAMEVRRHSAYFQPWTRWTATELRGSTRLSCEEAQASTVLGSLVQQLPACWDAVQLGHPACTRTVAV